MDISDDSSQESFSSSQILPLGHSIGETFVLNNKKNEDTLTLSNKNLSSENATNSHPLMYSASCKSPISPDYPDLIPEKPKSKHSHHEKNLSFNPQAHSTTVENNSTYHNDSFDKKLHFDVAPIEEYHQKLPG